MHMTTLESRSLLSAAVSLSEGVLMIRGSSGSDRVVVGTSLSYRKTANRIVSNEVVVTLNHVEHRFDADAILAVTAKLGAGDDVCSTFTRQTFQHLVVTHGRIHAAAANWTVNIYGEAGNDSLDGSNDSEMIDGGAGHDNIRSEGGDDHIYGGDGNDFILEEPHGADELTGGADWLDGGAGDDVFVLAGPPPARFVNVIIHGGSGHDRYASAYATQASAFSVDPVLVGSGAGGRLTPDRGWVLIEPNG